MRPSTPLPALAAEIARLAAPAIVQGLLHTAVLFTDRLLLGRFSPDALASMQISGPLLWSVFSVCGAMGAGIVAVVGRAVGAGQVELARRTVSASLAFAGGVGLLVGLLGFLLREPIALGMGGAGEPAVQAMALTYMGWLFAATPLQVLGAAAMTALQAGGDTRTPMRVSVVAGVLNLVLSYGLLFGAWGLPALGVAGSAIGSVAAFALHALVLLGLLRRRGGPVSLGPPYRPLLPALRPVLKVSLPTLGEKLVFHSGFLVFAGLVGQLGPVAMAANQSLIAIESLGFIAAAGFGVASGSLVARRLGADQPEEAARVGWVASALGMSALGLVSLLFLLLPELLVGAFTTDPEVIATGADCLRVAALAQPLMALADTLASSLRAAGDTRSPLRIALVGPVFVRLIACVLLAFVLDMGLLGIWIGTTIDWAVRCLALVVVWSRGRWVQAFSPAHSPETGPGR